MPGLPFIVTIQSMISLKDTLTHPQVIRRFDHLQHHLLLFVIFLVILGANCSQEEPRNTGEKLKASNVIASYHPNANSPSSPTQHRSTTLPKTLLSPELPQSEPQRNHETNVPGYMTDEELQNHIFENVKFVVKKEMPPLSLNIYFKWPSKGAENKMFRFSFFILRQGPRPGVPFKIKETHYTSVLYNTTRRWGINVKNSSLLPITYNSVYKMRLNNRTNYPSKFYTLLTPLCSKPNNDNSVCISNDTLVKPSELKGSPVNDHETPTLKLLCFNHEDGRKSLMIKVDWVPIEETNHTISNVPVASKEEIKNNVTYSLNVGGGITRNVSSPYTLLVSLNSKHKITLLALVFSQSIIYKSLYVDTTEGGLQALRKNEQICPVKKVADHGQITVLVVMTVLLMSILAICMAVWLMRMIKKQMKNRNYNNGFTKTNSYKSNPSGSMNVLRESVSTNGSNNTATTSVDEWEVDPEELILDQEIGHGAFGRVVCGWYKKKMVAIKVLKETIPNLYRDELLREIALLKGMGSHPNIVSILGASTIKDPIALIMEYVPFGDMHSFLKRCKNNFDWKEDSKELVSTHCLQDQLTGAKEVWQVTSKDLISWSRQIALAMEYLASKQYVHRDLAARNVLMASNKSVMLCDFGLARVIYSGDNHYFRRTNCKLPLKWMAIESIKDRLYTSKSDVWSFGILLWEIATFGSTPYENIPIVDLYKYLAGGYRMNQPWNCSNELYQLMMNCWEKNPDDRPSFSQLRSSLEVMLSRGVDYLDLDIGNSSPNTSPLLDNNLALKDNKLPSYDYDSNEKKNLYNDTVKNDVKLAENQNYKKIINNKDMHNAGNNEMMYTKNSTYNDEFCVVLNNAATRPQLVKSSEFSLGKLPESYNSKVVKNTCYGNESEMKGIHKNNLWPRNDQPLTLPFTELLLKLNGFNGEEVMNNSINDRKNLISNAKHPENKHKNGEKVINSIGS